MNKRILFIRAHRRSVTMSLKPLLMPPIGLLYMAAVIREAFPQRYEIRVLHLGQSTAPLKSIHKEMIRFTPDIVGISAMTPEADLMHAAARVAKELRPEAKVIAGGPHPSCAPDETLQNESIDVAVLGEGEQTICELLQIWDKGGSLSQVKGIAYRRNGTMVTTAPRPFIQDLDALPLPAWDLIDLGSYTDYATMSNTRKGELSACLVTSRGCPYQCMYCHRLHGKRFRTRSPENVFTEIRLLHDRYGVTEFQIIDDCFNLDIERAMAICDLITQSKRKLFFTLPNGVRGDRMTEELVLKLLEAGVYKIHYAVETATPRLQQLIRKNVDLDKIKHIIDFTARTPILTTGFFMLGFPTETREEILDTIQFALESHLDSAVFFRVVPFPNTDLWNLAVAEGAQLGAGFGQAFRDYHFTGNTVATVHVTSQELAELWMYAYWSFYRSPSRVLRFVRKHPNKRLAILNLTRVYRNAYRLSMAQSIEEVKPHAMPEM